ncbi:unnamed protein product [Peronospora belbahrii]|uniref:DUF4219 domain-containing protein n=1 Tax=Peronospora belbahrii TaxID=622444 RepID=A0ABN8DAY8_9STRA|nr:unnamed protein product [Peronospora belbahrii]
MSLSFANSAQDLYHAFAVESYPFTAARINKFSETNFHVWEFKMQLVLEDQDLWGVVSGKVKLKYCTSNLDQATLRESRGRRNDNLSCDGGFAVATGLLSEGSV